MDVMIPIRLETRENKVGKKGRDQRGYKGMKQTISILAIVTDYKL